MLLIYCRLLKYCILTDPMLSTMNKELVSWRKAVYVLSFSSLKKVVLSVQEVPPQVFRHIWSTALYKLCYFIQTFNILRTYWSLHIIVLIFWNLDHLVLAILTALFCCQPLHIPSPDSQKAILVAAVWFNFLCYITMIVVSTDCQDPA